MCQKVLLGSGWELKQPRGKVLAVVVREKPNALEIVGEQVVKTADRLENRGGRLGCPPALQRVRGLYSGSLRSFSFSASLSSRAITSEWA